MYAVLYMYKYYMSYSFVSFAEPLGRLIAVEAQKQLTDYRYKLKKAEQDITALEGNVSAAHVSRDAYLIWALAHDMIVQPGTYCAVYWCTMGSQSLIVSSLYEHTPLCTPVSGIM